MTKIRTPDLEKKLRKVEAQRDKLRQRLKEVEAERDEFKRIVYDWAAAELTPEECERRIQDVIQNGEGTSMVKLVEEWEREEAKNSRRMR